VITGNTKETGGLVTMHPRWSRAED